MTDRNDDELESDHLAGPDAPVERAERILSPAHMKSIGSSMSKMNLAPVLSPSTLRILEEVRGFSGMLPNASLMASMFSASKGAESLFGSIKVPSLLSGSTLSSSYFSALNTPSITSSWRDTLSTPGIVDSLRVPSIFSFQSDLIADQSFINSIVAPMRSIFSDQLASLKGLGGIESGFFGDLDWITSLTKDLKLTRGHLPSNWRTVELEPDDLEDEVREILEEGIPLAWVPSARVIELLLAAPDAPARRRVITSNHRGIVTGCEQLVGRLAQKRALIYVDMIRKAIRALRDGHVEAAQSLATNVLDTLVSQHSKDALQVAPGVLTNVSSYKKFRKQSWRLTLAVHPVTTIMSGRFTLTDRPDGYRRNATAHAITRHQYNRINAVLAIMNATSLLTCFVRDTPAFD